MADNRRTLLGWIWPPPTIARRLAIAVAAAAGYSVLAWALNPASGVAQPVWSSQFAMWNTAILGLLVSFRTKVAYDRWWEGRILWGGLVNHSRNLCLKARELATPDVRERHEFAGLVAGFAVALMKHLRGPTRLSDVSGFEKQTVDPQHVPAYIAGRLIGFVAGWRRAGRIDGHMQQILDTNLNALMDVCGACERIRNTPHVPSYLSLLRHGLVLGFLVTPWALVEPLGAWVILVLPVMVYFLFGIELTAEAVEQPFGRDGDDLALETYCETIRKSATDILS
ncbi:bestrophin family ion channel [Gemmata sp. JC717]|uniref:bestrophin family ion channel n=1 Tax=Gemmata algarum TaxID=2975278 RepID=UPI0021BB6EC6|nr:bestrophin family ion channel [Gemmata algarum]MDY3555799.1 bestrophin family ion channel [Gemmata algarum]